MPTIQKNSPRYDLCNQTVTLYHRQGKDDIRRVVIRGGAHLELRKHRNMDKTGSREENSFLCVIPQGADGKTWLPPGAYTTMGDSGCYTLVAGDRLLLGEGAEVKTDEAWGLFVPAKVDGLVVVAQIDPRYWRGELCHLEVG